MLKYKGYTIVKYGRWWGILNDKGVHHYPSLSAAKRVIDVWNHDSCAKGDHPWETLDDGSLICFECDKRSPSIADSVNLCKLPDSRWFALGSIGHGFPSATARRLERLGLLEKRFCGSHDLSRTYDWRKTDKGRQ